MNNSLVRHSTILATLVTLFIAGAVYAPVLAGQDAEVERSFVLRAGRLLPCAPGMPVELRPGIIVVRDGRIAAVGSAVGDVADLPVIDLPDAVVMPGLVAAATELAADHQDDKSMAAGLRAIDAFDRYGNYAAALAQGITTVHIDAGDHRLITGQGAVVKLGGPASQRVLAERSDLTLNLGECAFNPPRDVTYTAPSSSDQPIPPAERQRPSSRLGQVLALEELVSAAAAREQAEFDMHLEAFRRVWRDRIPLRLQVDRGADIAAAVAFVREHGRSAYLVGGAEAHAVASLLRRERVGVVYRMPDPLRALSDDLGHDPNELDPSLVDLQDLYQIALAIAGPSGAPVQDLRLAAATALSGGLSRERVLNGVTRVPAEILGVHTRVGSLEVGKDADLVVFAGDPLDTSAHAQRVYIGGEIAFSAPTTNALVVRAGIVWVSDEHVIENGAVLVEDGKVAAVGRTVPHPPFARVIDAGPDAFVTPGFIDAFGHLGLGSGRTQRGARRHSVGGAPGPEVSLATIVGVSDLSEHRVARAGVTTVLLSPPAASSQGSQVTAIKTYGKDREKRVVRRTSGVYFDLKASDPMGVETTLKGRLESGKKYREKWLNYEKELAEWKDKMAKGEAVDGKPKVVEAQEKGKEDPITGTWAVTISGGPIPEPQSATLKLKLTGSDIEGRIIVPGAQQEAKVVATFDGKHISGEILIDTPSGYPRWEADLVGPDHIVGVLQIEAMQIDMEATRTDKSDVEFRVVKRRTRGKDGRPLPPKVDEALEPLRAVLDQKIPLVVATQTAAQIEAAMTIAEKFEAPLVLLGADDAVVHVERLKEKAIGVVVETPIETWRNDRRTNLADQLARGGVDIAFASGAEDGARNLPNVGLYAVERGLSPDAALAAFTTRASRMLKLDQEIGSLEKGRSGDLVIFDGHPFAPGSRVRRVIINGEVVR